MSDAEDPSPRLRREDSLALDGRLDERAAARLVRTDDAEPARRRARERLAEALGLWADEARAAGASVDGDALAGRVLAAVRAAPREPGPQPVPWGYAAAAAALLAVGLSGLALVRPAAEAPGAPGVASAIEDDGLALLRRLELERLALVEARR